MNRTKKFLYNSSITAIYQLFVMLAGFITPKIILQFYGSEINGLVSSITQFITYFNLVEAGLSGAAVYALYKPLADNDSKTINGVISATKKFYNQAGIIFVALTVGLAILYPMFVKIESVSSLDVGFLVMILGVNGALEFFTLAKYRALLTADQLTYVISIASLIHIVVNTMIIVLLASVGVSIVVLRLVALLSIFLRSIILKTYVKRRYKYLNYKEKPLKGSLDKRWDALYLQVLGAIHTGAPVIILTVTLGDLTIVSIYTIFNMVVAGINSVLSIFISGLSASFGEVIVRGEKKTLQNAYNEFEFSYYSLLATIYSIAFITIMPFIRIYTHDIMDANYDLPIIGMLFVLNGFMFNVKTPQGMLVISAGMYKETRWQTTIQGTITVVGGILLAPFWGLAGVLIASILSNIYRDIDLLFFVPKNITGIPVKSTILRWLRMVFSSVIICLPFIMIFDYNPLGYLNWAIYAIIIGIYSIVVVSFIGFLFDRVYFKRVINRMLSVVGGRK